MRRIAHRDRNHEQMVKAFRQIGATVQDLANVGGGCPDLIVGFRGRNVLVEVKSPQESSDHRKPGLNKAQMDWHEKWGGQVCVAETIEEAVRKVIAAVGA